MLIPEVELQDIVRDCLDILPAGMHSGLICACQGTEGHTWLQRETPAATPPCLTRSLPYIHSVLPVKKGSFVNGHHHHLLEEVELGQPELCTAKTRALQASDHSQDQFRYDAGVATGFPCGKEIKLDSCMLCIFGVVRMMRIK